MYESRRGLAAGIVVAALGLLCLGGGIALLGWRLLEPDKAVIVPPGHTNVPVLTPTPGLLGTPVIPPALPDDPVGLVILPVSERTTLTPTPASRITVFRATVFRATVSRATITPSQILTAARSPIYTATVTGTPTGTLTNTPTRTLTHTSTPRPGPVNPTGTVGTAEPVTESPPSRTPTTTLTITFTPMQTPTYTPWPSPVPVVPERLVIDAIGLDVPVIPVGQHTVTLEGVIYSQWNVPDNGAAGWHQDSARLGESGNLVLNGHHNTNGEVFRYLVALHPGDLIRL
ncbi:MAG: sortase, partial [Anaerolineae bacterium]|nr:sortase [Anaerolineae bacterium]